MEFARTKSAGARFHENRQEQRLGGGRDANTQNARGSDSFSGKPPELAKLGKVKNIHRRVLLHSGDGGSTSSFETEAELGKMGKEAAKWEMRPCEKN